MGRGWTWSWIGLGASTVAATVACGGPEDGRSTSFGSGLTGPSATGAVATSTADTGPGGSDTVGPPATSGGSDGTAASDTASATTGPAVDPCEPIAGVEYTSLGTIGDVTDMPADVHPDLNMSIRGWSATGGTLGLVSYGGDTDALAPRLNSIFDDDAMPAIVANYRVNNWDWNTGMVAGPITDWDVTLVGFGTTAGQVLELPRSGYDIGGGLQARVLFVDDDSITLKYTLEDNVVLGYALHIEGLCVEPSLRGRYDADVAAGRAQLPAVGGDQPIGRARGSEILVAIRDTGAFMDPRSDKDWWD